MLKCLAFLLTAVLFPLAPAPSAGFTDGVSVSLPAGAMPLPDPVECNGYFEMGLDGNFYWGGCNTNSCSPNFGVCDTYNDPFFGWRTCKCTEGAPPAPGCQVRAVMDPAGFVQSWTCNQTGNCIQKCKPKYSSPGDNNFWPCFCQ